MGIKEKETVQFKITLTSAEFEILKEFAELQGKPMAGCFMTFIRDANVFKVLDGANKAMNGIVKMKKTFSNKVKDVSDDVKVIA